MSEDKVDEANQGELPADQSAPVHRFVRQNGPGTGTVAANVNGEQIELPKPMTLEWQQMPTRTGLYIECPRKGQLKVHGLIMGEGVGPSPDVEVPVIDCKGSWWLGPIERPQFISQ